MRVQSNDTRATPATRRWLAAAAALALGGAAAGAHAQECRHPAGNVPFGLLGDINGNGAVNVADALCSVLNVLTSMGPAQAGGWHPCLAGDALRLDLDCSGAIDTGDVQLVIRLAQGNGLPAEVASEPWGCADACEPCAGPSEGSCLIEGACVPEGMPQGGGACGVCDPEESAVAYSPAPNGTPCDPGASCEAGLCVPSEATEETCAPSASGAGPLNSASAPLESCAALRQAGHDVSGEYWIDPDGSDGAIAPFTVHCDMEVDGGGWTLLTNVVGAQASSTTSGSLADNFYFPNLEAAALGQLSDEVRFHCKRQGEDVFVDLRTTAPEWVSRPYDTGDGCALGINWTPNTAALEPTGCHDASASPASTMSCCCREDHRLLFYPIGLSPSTWFIRDLYGDNWLRNCAGAPGADFMRVYYRTQEPQCDGRQCGPDGLGGLCGECDEGETCSSLGQCVGSFAWVAASHWRIRLYDWYPTGSMARYSIGEVGLWASDGTPFVPVSGTQTVGAGPATAIPAMLLDGIHCTTNNGSFPGNPQTSFVLSFAEPVEVDRVMISHTDAPNISRTWRSFALDYGDSASGPFTELRDFADVPQTSYKTRSIYSVSLGTPLHTGGLDSEPSPPPPCE